MMLAVAISPSLVAVLMIVLWLTVLKKRRGFGAVPLLLGVVTLVLFALALRVQSTSVSQTTITAPPGYGGAAIDSPAGYRGTPPGRAVEPPSHSIFNQGEQHLTLIKSFIGFGLSLLLIFAITGYLTKSGDSAMLRTASILMLVIGVVAVVWVLS